MLFNVGDEVVFTTGNAHLNDRYSVPRDTVWKISRVSYDYYTVTTYSSKAQKIQESDWFHRKFELAPALIPHAKVIRKIKSMQDNRKRLGYAY